MLGAGSWGWIQASNARKQHSALQDEVKELRKDKEALSEKIEWTERMALKQSSEMNSGRG